MKEEGRKGKKGEKYIGKGEEGERERGKNREYIGSMYAIHCSSRNTATRACHVQLEVHVHTSRSLIELS